MIQLGLPFQPLQFDKATQGGKEMIGLRRDRLRGRLGQRDVLFERLMITFHSPPFVIGRGHVVKRQGGITGDQIANADTAIFVCEDLFDQHERKVDSFEIDFPRGLRFQLQGVHSDIAALLLVGLTQGDFAIGFQGTNKVAVLLLFDKDHGFCRGKPHIEEDKAKGNAIAHRLFDQLLTHVILGHRTAPLLLLRLGVDILLGLGHQVEAHRDTHALAAIQRRQEVDPFEQPIFGVVVMPTDNIVLVGVRLLLNRVVNDQHPGLGLHVPDKRLDGPPQIARGFLRPRQVPGHLIVADFPLQQFAQPRRRGRPKRGQQVIGIQIGYPVVLSYGQVYTFFALIA